MKVVYRDIRRVDIRFYPSSNRTCTVFHKGPAGDRALQEIHTMYS